MISNRFIYKKPKNTTKPVEDGKLSILVQAREIMKIIGQLLMRSFIDNCIETS